MADSERLKEIASNVATRYGYKDASAEFTPFKDFKVKWTRAFEWISLEVSDYLEFARTIYHEICAVQVGFPDGKDSEKVEELFARWEETAC